MLHVRKLVATILAATFALGCYHRTATAKTVNVPVVYYKLPNGLKVVISEDHVAPVVTVGVTQVNSYKFVVTAKYVEANGGNTNGHTDFDYTNYFETLPSNRVETGLWLESDRMRSLDISEENLKNQQNVVSEEVRVNVLNQPYQFFEWIDLWQNAFTNWNNAHNGYGDLAEINAATIGDVRSFFKTYYAPNNAVLTIVGDVDANEVKKMVEKHFGNITSQPEPKRPDLTEPPQTKEKRVSEKDRLANLPAIAIGYHMPAQNSPDFPAMALLVQVLLGDDSSRWYQRLVKEKELTLDLSGGLNYFGNEFDYNGPMIMTTRATYKPGHTADASGEPA